MDDKMPIYGDYAVLVTCIFTMLLVATGVIA